MIIALFALAVLMIVGGVASVVQGFPFVRLESGMAMTVAGATTASAGAVVLGLATVASHVRGLGRRLGAMRLEAPLAEAVPAAPSRASEPDVSEPAFAERAFAMPAFAMPALSDMPALGEKPPRQRPSLVGLDASREPGLGALGAAGLGAAGLANAGFGTGGFGGDSQGRGTEPTFILPPDPDLPAPPPPREAEPLLPDLLPDLLPPVEPVAPAAEAHPEPAESEPAMVSPSAHPLAPASAETALREEDRTLASLDTGSDAPAEPVRLYPSLDTMADITPDPVPAPPPSVVEDKPEIVGTYASGGNTYVMYANGSIEAETPRGRFSFDSLDELKAFVEAGGETDARGAA